MAAKLVLMKSILFSIHVHIMSCLEIPTMVCQQIVNYIHQYWWGQIANKSKTAWISWEHIFKRNITKKKKKIFFNGEKSGR